MSIITKLAVVPAAALAAVAGTAVAAASAGPPVYASCATNPGGACAGYQATGASFKFVTDTAFVADPSQNANVTDGLGWQVTLTGAGTGHTWAVDAGISDATTSGTLFDPAYDVYEDGTLVAGPDTNAQWCPAGGTCAPADLGGGFAQGDKVTQSLTYDRTNGLVNVRESDAAGNAFTASYPVGPGIAFGTARVEAGYDPGDFHAPVGAQVIVKPYAVTLTTYAGKHAALGTGPWKASPEIATSTGTSTGTVQASPGKLASTGKAFAIYFRP